MRNLGKGFIWIETPVNKLPYSRFILLLFTGCPEHIHKPCCAVSRCLAVSGLFMSFPVSVISLRRTYELFSFI